MQGSLEIPEIATYDEYLAMEQPEDDVSEVPIDPYSMESAKAPSEKVCHCHI